MKYIQFKTWLPLAALAAWGSFSSCDKLSDFGDTNVNPNGSSYVSTSTLISTAQARLGNNNFATNTGTTSPSAELLSGYFCQYFSEPTYPGAQIYAGNALQVNSAGVYSGILNDLQAVIKRNTGDDTKADAAKSGSNASQIAMARIMKAFIFWNLTDKWGDIPYFDALKGTEVLNPKYDSQELIYKDLIKELTEAVAQFDGGIPVAGDLVYSGNEAKWKKLANSLRMLIALRMSKKYPGASEYAATEFAAAVAAGDHITDNADNFKVYYPGNANPFNNPWYGPANSNDNGVSKTLTDILTAMADTRVSAYATNNNGIPYGLDVPVSAAVNWARILSSTFKQTNGDVVLVSAASVLLARAEAQERGWITSGTAKASYDAGVAASFAQWGVTMPASYLTTGVANYTSGVGVASIGGASVAGSTATTTTGLQRIQLQQYLAYYPLGSQGWANWRRTGFPDIKKTIYAISNREIPRRLTYGTLEYSLNLEQVTQAASSMGGDNQDVKVWWDR